MLIHHPRLLAGSVAALALALGAPPLHAQSADELDTLTDASQAEEAGTALAQAQAARGEWLEALATLDRVLAVNPKSQGSRLLHALYLCEVDDKQGGLLELSRLRPRELAERRRDGEAILANAEARCRAAGNSTGTNAGEVK
jgi:hypothetical protein